MKRFKFIEKNKISKLPKNPGVYCFKKGGMFLYIGKAANIEERVKNHFHPVKCREAVILPKAKLFNRVKQIGYIKTDSEVESLILEANLIKKYQPKYNVVWRDDKNYFFVAINKEDFPRVFITHQIKPKTINYKLKTEYIGPFVDGKALKQALKILRKVFPYRPCKTLPKKPCLWYQLSRCPAPCLLKSRLAKQIPSAYLKMKKKCQESVKNLVKILQGKKKQVLKDLRKEMKKASDLRDFEKAAKVRDQILALEKVFSHAKIFDWVESKNVLRRSWLNYREWKKIEKDLNNILKTRNTISRIEAYDVSNIQGEEATGAMVTFIDGRPEKNFYRRFKIHPVKSARGGAKQFKGVKISGKPNDIAMIKEILSRRFQHLEWGWPDLVLIDGGISQLNAARSIKYKMKNTKLVPLIALAKKENRLYIENQKRSVPLKNLPREIFNLILQLRDEAHRFAITYHRKLRRRKLMAEK